MILQNRVEHFKWVLSWTAFHPPQKFCDQATFCPSYLITGLFVPFTTFLQFDLITPGAVWFSEVTFFWLPFGWGESALFLGLSAIYFSWTQLKCVPVRRCSADDANSEQP